MRRLVVVFFACLLFFGCKRTPEEKWYYHVLDSLGRIEAPLMLDTISINRQLNGRVEMDTVINNFAIYQYRTYGDYVILSRHRDSLIVDKYTYKADGKLFSWSRHFSGNRKISGGAAIVDYTKWYNKRGKIENFGEGELGTQQFPLPRFSIYNVIEKLRTEGVDVENSVTVNRNFVHAHQKLPHSNMEYPKLNWEVGVIEYYDDRKDYWTVDWREIDSDTGEVMREWSKSQGIE
jgi:hypothetical protein